MVGVYLSSMVEDDKNTTATLTFGGDSCPWPHFGPTCIEGHELTNNLTFTYDFRSGDLDQYFYYDAPAYDNVVVAHLSFSAKHSTGELAATEDINVYARYLGTPSINVNDGVDSPINSTVTIESPRRGWWVFYVHAITPGTYDFDLMERKCDPKSAGFMCQYE